MLFGKGEMRFYFESERALSGVQKRKFLFSMRTVRYSYTYRIRAN